MLLTQSFRRPQAPFFQLFGTFLASYVAYTVLVSCRRRFFFQLFDTFSYKNMYFYIKHMYLRKTPPPLNPEPPEHFIMLAHHVLC